MKTLIVVLLLISPALQAQVSTAAVKVSSIAIRANGHHHVAFNQLDGSDYLIPDEDPVVACFTRNRAVILESDVATQAILSVALTAMTTGMTVVGEVSGCAELNPTNGSGSTGPKLIKVKITIDETGASLDEDY